MLALRWFNVGLRAIVEVGIIVALAVWGFSTGATVGVQVALGVGAPAVVFGVWGLVDFRSVGRHAEVLRLLEELVLCTLAVVALYVADQEIWAWLLAATCIVHYALVYASGDRLLRSTGPASQERAEGGQ